jgi:ParB family chromosome partitioning protein
MEKKLGRGLPPLVPPRRDSGDTKGGDRLFANFDEPANKEQAPVEQTPVKDDVIEVKEAKLQQEAPLVLPPPSKPQPQIAEAREPVVQLTNQLADRPTGQADSILILRTDQLIPNRFQPRKTFDKASLVDLMESIKSAGVLQPILVRKATTKSGPAGNYYEIVAGERRWRACVELKVASVPVIVKDVDDQKMLEWALIENTQRKDLNPIERARAYKELMTFFNLTQEDIAGRVGLDRATVANFIRLLDLPSEVQDELARETISTTHARGLLAISDPTLQIKLCHRIKSEGMSVRRLEYIIRWLKRRKPGTIDGGTQVIQSTDPHIRDIEERLMTKFNTKVSVYTNDNKQGKVMISFYSLDDFQRILDKLDQVK